jgi:hypothetical protein
MLLLAMILETKSMLMWSDRQLTSFEDLTPFVDLFDLDDVLNEMLLAFHINNLYFNKR